MIFDSNSRLRDVYAHPVGRDIIDLLLFAARRPRGLVTNGFISRLKLKHLGRLSRRFTGSDLVDTIIHILNSHPERLTGAQQITDRAWWKEAVFYQIYPRSFQDSNGDGIGDIPGIISRLDYLQDLGVDCVWLSPIFDSPNEDMGYDVRDYRAVMQEMGTMEDLDRLIEGCHEHGMRIILDLVVNHTSSEHEWFRRAEKDPDGPYGDYYFLRRGTHSGVTSDNPHGDPPNNWTSFFSGSAWRWIDGAERWGLHLFAPHQMDLNWENPAVRSEVADIVQFWLERGIDGFRMDVINYISKDERLPEGDDFVGQTIGFRGVEHYFYGPELHSYLNELRRRGFTRKIGHKPRSGVRSRAENGELGEPAAPDRVGVMIGETPGVGVEMGRLLTDPRRAELDLIFNFQVLENPGKTRWDDYQYDLNHMKAHYEDYLSRLGPNETLALFIENHDNPRIVSKVLGSRDSDPIARAAVAKAVASIQLLLRGTPFIYQGQELGAINQRFTSLDDLRDVESINRFGELRAAGATLGGAFSEILPGTRDHSRVPMRWDADGDGFSDGTPWIEGAEDSVGFSAAEEADDPLSVLNWYRQLIRLRREHDALIYGAVEFVAPGARDYFAWHRVGEDGTRYLVEVNLSGDSIPRRNFEQRTRVLAGTTLQRSGTLAPWESVVSVIL